MTRPLALPILLVLLPLLGAAAPASDPLAVRQQLVDAIAGDDLEAALALYSDDAVVAGSGFCMLEPCVTRGQIEADLHKRIDSNNRPTALANEVSGNRLKSLVQLRSDPLKQAGFERILLWVTYEVRAGKIASERVSYDSNDSETARFLRYLEAQTPME